MARGYGTVLDVLTSTFSVPPVEVQPHKEFGTLDLDSLARSELALILKETLGVPCSDQDVPAHATVGGLAALLDARLADSARRPSTDGP